MEPDGNINLLLPDGSVLPASPENRERAAYLWMTIDNEVDVKIDKELIEDEIKTEKTSSATVTEIDANASKINLPSVPVPVPVPSLLKSVPVPVSMSPVSTSPVTMSPELIEMQRERDEARNEILKMKLEKERDAAVATRDAFWQREMLLMADRHSTTLASTVKIAEERPEPEEVAVKPRSSGLPITDPAVNLVDEVVNLIPLDDHLRIDKPGNANVTTVSDLYNTTMKTATDLSQIVKGRPSHSSLRFALEKLKLSIRLRKQTGDAVAAGCIIQAAAIFCPELRYRLISALKMAASLCHLERLDILPQIVQQGKTLTIPTEMQSMTVEQLPGIAELVSNGWDSILVKSFEDLVLSYVCFDADVAEKLTASRALWQHVNAGNEKDCERYLFAENEAFESCTAWLGSAIVNDLDRFQNLLDKSSFEVKTAYISYLSNPENAVTQNSVLTMRFDQLVEVYRKSWIMAQTSARLTASLLSTKRPTANMSWVQLTSQIAPVSGGSVAPPLRSAIRPQLSDITLHCAENGCNQPFVFTVKDQMYHREKGYENQPKRCLTHRRSGICTEFANTGFCSYGAGCKFQHSGSENIAENANPPDGCLQPGSVKENCPRFAKGTCVMGENCIYQHHVADIVPETGFTGLAVPRGVRFAP